MKRRHVLASLALGVGLMTGCADMEQPPEAEDLVSGEGSPEIAAQQAPANNALVKLHGINAIGTGCAPGSWIVNSGIDADGAAYFNLNFSEYSLQGFPGGAINQSKNCKITFDLDVKPGYKAGIAKALFYVSAELGAGMLSNLQASVGFAGQAELPMNFPLAGPTVNGLGNFQLPVNRLFPGASPYCRSDADVQINTALTLQNPLQTSGSLNLRQARGNVTLSIKFDAIPCS